MKVAKLPTGKILKFHDDTPDEAIDSTVKNHLLNHTKKIQEQKQRIEEEKSEISGRHNQLIQMFTVIAQLLQQQTQLLQEQDKAMGIAISDLMSEIDSNHKDTAKLIETLIESVKAPRLAVRNSAGKIISSRIE